MSIKKLKEILDEVDYPVFMEIIDCMWCRGRYGIEWNTDNNKEDLVNGGGDTYSTETRDGETEYDGYLVVNGDTCCGETATYFFNLSKEVKF